MSSLSACRTEKTKPNLLIITIDTLRADHLSLYGYNRLTSPNLDALGREGLWFKDCSSQSTTTFPSHVTLFTSLYPQSHGVINNDGDFPQVPSIMDRFREAGYDSAGFVSSSVLGRRKALGRKFHRFDNQLHHKQGNRTKQFERPAEETLKSVNRWFEDYRSKKNERPFFVWIHLNDPHGPYDPPAQESLFINDAIYQQNNRILEFGEENWTPFRIPAYQKIDEKNSAGDYIARYDSEIHYADRQLGLLFQKMKELGIYDSTFIVVTADHGETMTEHKLYFSHGYVAYHEDVKVPLIVKDVPDHQQLRDLSRDTVFRLIDLAPTILSVFGLKSYSSFQGKDLTTQKIGNNEPVFTFGSYESVSGEIGPATQFSIRNGQWRYIRNVPDKSEELFNEFHDPVDANNVVNDHPDVVSSLRSELDKFFKNAPSAKVQKHEKKSAEEQEELKSLGYLN